MSSFALQPAFEIGQRVELRGLESCTWLIITFSTVDLEALDAFKLEIEATIDLPFRIIDAGEIDLLPLLYLLHSPDNDGIILTGFDNFGRDSWIKWDINRSRFQRPGPIIFWLSMKELTQFCASAPNLKSFIGGSIYALSPSGGSLTEEERSQKIKELEDHYQTSSHSVIEAAQSGKLPPEPHFVEWLVLLNRGDLI